MKKNIEEFMEALEASTRYEEGAADLIHKAGTAIKNFFGTNTGAAQRAAQDAQRNAQTQATQQKADEIYAQNMSSVDLATKINQVITGALKIANKGLNKAAKAEQAAASENPTENNKQNNNSEQTAGENAEVTEENSQQKTQESLTRLLSALYEADASKNQEYYQTAIKNLQDIQNLVKPFLQGQKEFDKKTLKTISDKINDQSIQGVLAKNDKKALQAIQGLNTAINGKIQVLQKSKQQQTQNSNAQNNTASQPVADNSQQQNTEQTQNSSQEQTQNTTTEQPTNNQQTQQSNNQQQNTDTQQNGTEQQTQTQNTDAQNKDPAQMQPEEIKQQPEGQQASKEYNELESAITNLTKKFGNNKAIKTLGNAWETFKSMNSKGGADKILQ